MEENKRDFKGIWIPKELWFEKGLSLQEKCFIAEINSLDNDNGCFASNEHFAKITNLSKNRCTEVIKSLEKKNIISIEYEYENKAIKKRIIKLKKVFGLSSTYSESEERGIRNPGGGYSEKCEDRITIENNNIEVKEKEQKSDFELMMEECEAARKKLAKEKRQKNKFTPPTLEEVTEYCKLRKNNIDPKRFFDYYEAGNWKDAKGEPVKNWKQRVITWEGRNKTNNNKQIEEDTSPHYKDGSMTYEEYFEGVSQGLYDLNESVVDDYFEGLTDND